MHECIVVCPNKLPRPRAYANGQGNLCGKWEESEEESSLGIHLLQCILFKLHMSFCLLFRMLIDRCRSLSLNWNRMEPTEMEH